MNHGQCLGGWQISTPFLYYHFTIRIVELSSLQPFPFEPAHWTSPAGKPRISIRGGMPPFLPWINPGVSCREFYELRTRIVSSRVIRHGVSLPSWGMAQISRCIVFPALAYACGHWAERLHTYAFLLALPAPTP